MELFSFSPSQRSVIKAYAECAEMLVLRTTRWPLPDEVPMTAYGILEEYKGLAETYEKLEEHSRDKFFATGTAKLLQAKMQAIDALPERQQRLYRTEPKDAFRRNMVFDGAEFYGFGFERYVNRKPEKFYGILRENIQHTLEAIDLYGAQEFGTKAKYDLKAGEQNKSGRLERRVAGYSFLK